VLSRRLRMCGITLLCVAACRSSGAASEQAQSAHEALSVDAAKQILALGKTDDINEVCIAVRTVVSAKNVSADKLLLDFLNAEEVVEKLETNANGKPNVVPGWRGESFDVVDRKYRGRWKPYLWHPNQGSDLYAVLRAIIRGNPAFGEEFVVKTLDDARVFDRLLARQGGEESGASELRRLRNECRVEVLGVLMEPSKDTMSFLRAQVLDRNAPYCGAATRVVLTLLGSQVDELAKGILWERLLADYREAKNLGLILSLQERRHLPGAFELLCDAYEKWGKKEAPFPEGVDLLDVITKPKGVRTNIEREREASSYDLVEAKSVPRFLAAMDKLLKVSGDNKLKDSDRNELDAVRAALSKKTIKPQTQAAQ